jgi:lipooligosaccharide transport system ATP-binding protein
LKNVVEAKDLVKSYGEKAVVDRLNLEVQKGECFGLLGPNGAGKSTTMKMMYCSVVVTEGELYVLGLNVKKNFADIKARIGVVPQDDGLDPDFTVLENLLVYASYFKIPKAEAITKSNELLRMMKLEDYQDRSVETLSGGMRRRLAIARGLLNQPELIFLDEPTTGLDPQARILIWDFFKKLRQENVTVLLTTHYMEEAEELCDRVAIIDHGKILAIGSPERLVQEHVGKEIVYFRADQKDLSYYAKRVSEAGYEYQVFDNQISVMIKQHQDGKKILDLVRVSEIGLRKATLNDVFLKLAGYQLKEGE